MVNRSRVLGSLERFQIMCSRKERKGWHSARNTETFVAAGRRGSHWAWPVASPRKRGMRRPIPCDASITAAAKGHGSPASRGHKIRRGAPARNSRTHFSEGRSPFPCRDCGPFRVRQGERHEAAIVHKPQLSITERKCQCPLSAIQILICGHLWHLWTLVDIPSASSAPLRLCVKQKRLWIMRPRGPP